MEIIAVVEERIAEQEAEVEYHSFWPQPLPDNVSQLPPSMDQRRTMAEAKTTEARQRAIPVAQRYLPCHYFDYICGSSTGA